MDKITCDNFTLARLLHVIIEYYRIHVCVCERQKVPVGLVVSLWSSAATYRDRNGPTNHNLLFSKR